MKEGHARRGPVPEETGAGQAMCSEHSRNRRSSSFSVVWGLMTRNWASCAGASPANDRLRSAVRQSAPGCHCRHSTMVPSHRQISETCRRWWMSRRSSSGRVISTSVARWGGDMMAGSNPQPPGPPVREPASRSDRARVPAAVRTAETSWIHRWRAAGRGLPRDVPRTGQAGHSGARAAETRSAARGGPRHRSMHRARVQFTPQQPMDLPTHIGLQETLLSAWLGRGVMERSFRETMEETPPGNHPRGVCH